MKHIKDLIAEHGLLADLDPRMIEVIAGCGQNVGFEDNEYILKEGGPADQFYLLRKGHVSLEMYVPGRGNVIFQTLSAGDMIGVSWLVEPYIWSFDARALENARAVAFNAKCLRDKIEQDSALGYALMKKFVPVLLSRINAARLQTLDLYKAGG